MFTSVFQVTGLPKNIAVQYILLHRKNQTRKMIEREEKNKENTNSGTISASFSAKMEEDNLVEECHEKSIKYMLIILLSFCFISIAQNIDLPRTNQTIWSQQTKKRLLYVNDDSTSSREKSIAKES